MDQNRFKSKYLWLAVASLISLVLKQYGLFEFLKMTPEFFQTFVDGLLMIAVLLGVVNDPTDAEKW